MICIIAPYFRPAIKAGGPIKSIGGICDILDTKLEYDVITRDHDIDGSKLEPKSYLDNVLYVSKPSIKLYRSKFDTANIVWINSLYSYGFTILPIIALLFSKSKTVLISPRGQLLDGALNAKKKVFLFVLMSALSLLRHKVIFHFTNPTEIKKSKTTFKNYPKIIFNNPISGKIQPHGTVQTHQNTFVLGFFGRISPIKNIEFLLNLLPKLDESVILEIHGSIEDEAYFKSLNELVADLGISNRISFCGNYNKNSFADRIQKTDLVLIPSLSENFCHVMFESIEFRKMVIVSEGLPWQEANEYLPKTLLKFDQKEWVDRIKEVKGLSFQDYKAQQDKQVEFYQSVFAEVQDQIITNFQKLVE